ncbi:MAG: glycosyltransferase, partial [Desulfatiglans sp.]|nr:glycosyltransferase [Desulfatiglans sp.]
DVNQIFAGVKFDYILFETGLENYPKPMRMVRKLERRLTVGGYLALRTSSPALKKGIREIYPTVATAGDWSVISEQTFLSRNNRPKHDTVICLNSKPEGTSAEPTSIVPREEMHDQGLENQHGKDMPKTTTSIIIPVPKSKKQLRDCVRAIEKHTPETFEIVFVSSIPKGKAPKWLKETLRQNKGYCFFDSHGSVQPGKIYNEGIKGSVGDYVVLLAPDIVVFDGWLSGMLSCLNRIQDAGIVAPMTNRAKGIQKIPSPDDHSIDRLDAFSRSFTERNRYRRVSVLKTEGFCMLFKRELTEHIGLLSEEVDSDDLFAEDFSLRAASVGYSNLIAGDVFVHRQEQTAMKKSAPPTKWVSADFQSSFQNKSFVPSLIAKARGLDQQDKADLALKSLIDGIGQVPDDKRLYQTLAELLLRHGQYQDALDALNEMPGGEGDLRKLELTAYCLEGLEKYPEAGAYAEEILSCDPDSSLALNLKGILAYRQGDKDKAEMLFKGSIESDPGFGEPHTNLGVLKWEGGEPDQALDLLERGFILSPILTDVVTLYHTAITDLSRFDRAEPILRDAVALYPSDKRLKHLLIDDLIKQAKHSQAMEVIEEAMVSFDLQEGFLRAALEVRKRVGPYTTIDAVEKGYSVSLCMIVKDEEQYLAQCLASLKPVVDEIIVIDTGSKDQTKDIAKVFGAQVFDYEWNDDFSTARNSAIEKASGDWILVMDADEVISTQDHEQLRQLIKRSHAGHVAFSFTTRNYINQVNTIGFHPNKGDYAQEEAAMGWMPSDKVRLFPNNGDIRFEFPIHEKVEPSLRRKGLEIKRCQVPVHHYGKLNEEKGDKKCAAYYELGRKKLDELGGDIDAIRELAVQAETIGKETEAIELWQRLLTLQPNAAIALVNMATLYLKLNRYEEARETAQQAAHIAPQMKEALHNYALCEFYCGNVDQTITLLQRALEQDPDYLSARFLLAVAYCCAGTQSEGLRIFSELESTTGQLGLAVACHTFAEKLVAAQKADYAMSLLKTAVGAKYSNPDVIKLYDQLFQTWTKTTLSGSSNSGFGTVRKESPNPSVYGALQ